MITIFTICFIAFVVIQQANTRNSDRDCGNTEWGRWTDANEVNVAKSYSCIDGRKIMYSTIQKVTFGKSPQQCCKSMRVQKTIRDKNKKRQQLMNYREAPESCTPAGRGYITVKCRGNNKQVEYNTDPGCGEPKWGAWSDVNELNIFERNKCINGRKVMYSTIQQFTFGKTAKDCCKTMSVPRQVKDKEGKRRYVIDPEDGPESCNVWGKGYIKIKCTDEERDRDDNDWDDDDVDRRDGDRDDWRDRDRHRDSDDRDKSRHRDRDRYDDRDRSRHRDRDRYDDRDRSRHRDRNRYDDRDRSRHRDRDRYDDRDRSRHRDRDRYDDRDRSRHRDRDRYDDRDRSRHRDRDRYDDRDRHRDDWRDRDRYDDRRYKNPK